MSQARTGQAPPAQIRTDWTGVAFGTVLGIVAAYQQFKVPPAIPILLREYGYGSVLAGGLMSVYALMGLVLSLAVGRAVSRRGWSPVVATGLVLMLAGNGLGLAWPENGAAMLAARALEGASYAVLGLVGPILANASGAGAHMPLVFALTAAWIPHGQIAAGVLAGATPGEWRWLWWGGLLSTALVLAWSLRLGLRRRFAGFAMGGRAEGARLTSRERLGMVLVAATFLLWSMQYFAFMTWLPEYLVTARGLDAGAAIRGYLIPVVTLLVFVYLAAFLLRAGASLGALLIATLFMQAGAWLVMPMLGDSPWAFALLILWGIGAGITPTCLFGFPATLVQRADARTEAFGIMMTGRNLGVLIGPVLLGAAIERTGWSAAFPVCATLATGAMAVSIALALLRRAGRA